MKVRYVKFKATQDLPGRSGAENAFEFDPAAAHQLGFDMSVDWGKRTIRLAVPDALREGPRGLGAWRNSEGKPVYGLGAVRYIPFEDVRYFELTDDAVPKKVESPLLAEGQKQHARAGTPEVKQERK